MKRIFIIFTIIAITTSSTPHPLHIALTNIEYKGTTKQLTLMSKIFVDDFQTAIQRNYNVALNLGKSNQHPQTNLYIKQYIEQHLQIYPNSSKQKLSNYQLQTVQTKDDAVWVTIICTNVAKIKTIKIRNTIMTDMFADQKNLTIFASGKFEDGKSLDIDDNEVLFEVK